MAPTPLQPQGGACYLCPVLVCGLVLNGLIYHTQRFFRMNPPLSADPTHLDANWLQGAFSPGVLEDSLGTLSPGRADPELRRWESPGSLGVLLGV